MGKIVDMQHHQTEMNSNYVKKNNPKLDTKGIKNFYNKLRLAYKPGIEKEYNLTRSQKKFARTVRKTTLGIVALASALTIGTTVSNHISRNDDKQIETTYETNNEILSRNEVLDNAKSTLSNIIFPEGSVYHKSAYISFPSRDEFREINSVQVSMSYEYTDTPEYRYISGHKVNKQNPEIVNGFLEKFVKIAGTEEPSQKDLEELQELSDTISKMNLKLDGKNIVDLDEKESDFERD